MRDELRNLKELQHCIKLLEDLNGKRQYTNYDSLIKDLLVNFGIKVDRKVINQLNEPTLEEEILDKKLMYRNVYG